MEKTFEGWGPLPGNQPRLHPRLAVQANLLRKRSTLCVKPPGSVHKKSLRSSTLRKTRSRLNPWNRRTRQLKTKNSTLEYANLLVGSGIAKSKQGCCLHSGAQI